MPLYLFYTMVQKSQKWPKTQIKGGPALGVLSKVRTSRTNERTFIWEGGGQDPIRCAIDSKKKKKKKHDCRPIALGRLQLKGNLQ